VESQQACVDVIKLTSAEGGGRTWKLTSRLLECLGQLTMQPTVISPNSNALVIH
jgi:hypothetical protein